MVDKSGQAKSGDGIQVDWNILKTHMTEAREGICWERLLKKSSPGSYIAICMVYLFFSAMRSHSYI